MKTAKACTILFILLLSTITAPVCAAESVSFATDSVTCSVNRLFDIGVHAQGSSKISAVFFEFRFDQSLVAFREVFAPDGASVVSRATENTVTVSYLCEQGADLSANPSLLTLRFKSLAAGITSIEYTVKECVDTDAQFLSVGNCTAGRITMEGTATTTAKANKTKTTKATDGTKAAKAKEAAAKESTAPTGEEMKNLGTINSVVQKESDKHTPLIVLCASVVIAGVCIAFFIYKIKTDKKKK